MTRQGPQAEAGSTQEVHRAGTASRPQHRPLGGLGLTTPCPRRAGCFLLPAGLVPMPALDPRS